MDTLGPFAQQLKQCQNCFKSELETNLKTCTGCKRVHYCSPACQTEHWRVHKDLCKELKQMRTAMKSDRVTMTPALMGLRISKIEEASKTWVQMFRPQLTTALFHALELRTKPEQPLTHVLVMMLSTSFGPQHVPRKKAEIRRAFKPMDMFVATIDDCTATSSVSPRPVQRRDFDQLLDKTRAMRAKNPAVVGYALVLIFIPTAHIARLVPLGTDARYTELPPWDPAWKEDLEKHISHGISM